ncbi:MAG: penicillin-binding protein 2 MrdA [Roseibaca calidilacus]|uniref:Penicillin-binding protein 2 MrdA n=1 Tax=Roseibaca calidilacus TaxID=1666912 RepID=A0A0P7VSS5_9RHOB|nr:penicillin-binding protein 2 [Roseibaca calidilacus]KPP89954.1 MAG: penicillin-binding protein 2 MrdA [Roseibaca calidilacus]CUX81056.1 peptidoglycan glycosyltransferase [Roseibaca calidilacus]
MKRTDREKELSRRLITRRALGLGAIKLVVTGALLWRLRDMQLEQADAFRLLAEENRINLRLLPPTRGLIHDRNGVLLAGNEQNYRVVITRDDAGDIDLVLGRLQKLIGLPDDTIARAREDMLRNRPFVPITVAERLSWEEISAVAANAPALPGVTPEMGLSRVYPLTEDLSHVVGYVGPVSDQDLAREQDPDPVLMIPRFQIGKSGVEREAEARLRGKAGSQRVEVNSVGRVMRELDRVGGEPGETLHLTIDARLQNYAMARLEGQSAAAVVIDIESGDILASASAPSYDANLFVRGISSKNYNALLENEYRPLVNKCVQGMYPPGSTFKMVTALAALDAAETDGRERVFCPGHMDVSGNRFHCWKRSGHGRVDLVAALSESCDVYFYEMSQRCGIDRINAMAERLGIGIRYQLPLTSVAAGLNPSREWKARTRDADWRIGDTVNVSIGQGYVLTTPLQLAIMTARLASNRAVVPRLLRDPLERAVPQAASLDLRPEWLDMIRRGMAQSVNDRRGTAYSSRVVEPTMAMAGKTGTSQVFRITQAERDAGIRRQEDLPWNRRNHALFVNFAPLDNPRVAVAVIVEHGGGGSTAAAPIGRDILLAALNDGRPPLAAYPTAQRNRISAEQTEMENRLRDLGSFRVSRA